MSQDLPSLGCGTLVEVRGDRWRLVETVEHQGCWSCRLAGASASNIGTSRTLLLPFDRPRPVIGTTRLRKVGRRRWVAALGALAASTCEIDGLRGVARADLDLLDYQLEPAIACAQGATRLLLADEVGLGKTIQAALVLADLRARDESVRALILCPAGLCSQWRHELRDRFGIDAELLDRATVRRLAMSSAEAGPWEQVPVALASVDFVKRPEVLRGMEPVRWDLLVVDEAHLCALAPERACAVNLLAARARRVVLLTATPHPGEPGAFEALCRIGRLRGEGPVLMFRRTRADLGLPVERHSRVLRVALSAAERRLQRLLERYTSAVWRAAAVRQSPADARLAMIVLRKRALSGSRSLLASLIRRRSGLAAGSHAPGAQLPLPFDEDGHEASDEEPGLVLSAPGLADGRSERLVLDRLVDLASAAAATDAKCHALARLLRRVREPAIVFTEYRDTLAHLSELCADRRRVAVIHGGMDRWERADSIQAFNRGSADLLLATDAAAHGLNLQARCRLVVSLELPWNPVRLEQRVGRVDRIGQKRAVHAIHLVARQTGEEHVLARLAQRLSRARQTLGSAGDLIGLASENEIAEAVFARRRGAAGPAAVDRPASLPVEAPDGAAAGSNLFVPGRLEQAARAEGKKLRQVRALASGHRGAAERMRTTLVASAPLWTALRLRRAAGEALAAAGLLSPRSLLAVFEVEVADGRGAVVGRSLLVLAGPAPGLNAAHRLQPAALLAPGAPVRTAFDREAGRHAEARLSGLLEPHQSRLACLAARERAVAEAAGPTPAAWCQPGLFDRRALRQLEEDHQARQARQAEKEAHLEAIAHATRLSLAFPPRLVLAAVLVT